MHTRNACWILLGYFIGACVNPLSTVDGGLDAGDVAQADASFDATIDVQCPDGGTMCSNGCTPIATDPLNCGACGNVCPGPHAGSGDGGAADGDDAHDSGVGDAGVTAGRGTPACVAAQCVLNCPPGTADCDHNPANGCETSIDTAMNCGACGTTCPSTEPVCSMSGTATEPQFACSTGCVTGQTLCGTSCSFVTSDPANCGSCGHACPTPPNSMATCNGNACNYACQTNYADCDHNAANGCEVDLQTDTASCGACGTVCSGAGANAMEMASCNSGTCGLACLPDYITCTNFIGGGGTSCQCGGADSTPTCSLVRIGVLFQHVCTLACATGFGNCDGNDSNGCETNTTNNDSNCGACGTVCGTGTYCCHGGCRLDSIICLTLP